MPPPTLSDAIKTFLAAAKRESLAFADQAGEFREQVKAASRKVNVLKATSKITGTVLAFTISELGVDKDGMPDAYAPPVSEDDPNTPLYPDTNPKDHIRNAIRHWQNAFAQDDPSKPWEWVGVERAADGADIDDRPFLRDSNGQFPIINDKPPYVHYYKTRTAVADLSGNAVNARLTPFAVLNGLPNNGIGLASAGVKMCDYGVVFRLDKPVATPFMYVDYQGKQSRACREFSLYVANMLGRGVPVGVIVFPGSALRNDKADTDSIQRETILRVMRLNGVDNFDDLLERLVERYNAGADAKKTIATPMVAVAAIRQALGPLGLIQPAPVAALSRHTLK